MRRFVQLMALLVMVLAGSLPGLYLLGPARAEPCCAHMAGGACPCRMPNRAPGPNVPCGLGATAPAAILAAPGEAAQTRPGRTEPLPFPPSLRHGTAARLREAGPSLLARPGPRARPGPDRQASLSVFRI